MTQKSKTVMDLNSHSVQKQLAALAQEKRAYQSQNKLFERLIDLARSCSESEMLRFSMQKTLELATGLSGGPKRAACCC